MRAGGEKRGEGGRRIKIGAGGGGKSNTSEVAISPFLFPPPPPWHWQNWAMWLLGYVSLFTVRHFGSFRCFVLFILVIYPFRILSRSIATYLWPFPAHFSHFFGGGYPWHRIAEFFSAFIPSKTGNFVLKCFAKSVWVKSGGRTIHDSGF